MNKDFIPYEEALVLKELGFDEDCFGFYNDMDSNKPAGGNFPCDGLNSAPLYSQAFRWFRETYNLMGCVQPIYLDETHTDYEFWYFIQGIEEDEDDEEVFYGTYEEAEYECLNRLINIVNSTINGK